MNAILFRAFLNTALMCGIMQLSSCAGLLAKKRSYQDTAAGVLVDGAVVKLQVKPEGTSPGSFMVSAMVVGGGMATLQGPFRWRFEAEGEAGRHEWLGVHRIRTRTEKSGRDEWYPTAHLGKRANFRPVKGNPSLSRARYEVPGMLNVQPAEDGALTVEVEISVGGAGRTERRVLRFRLVPVEKRQDEFVFLPTEIVKGIGTKPEDLDTPGWD